MVSRSSTVKVAKAPKAPLPLLQRDEYGALLLHVHLQPTQVADVRTLLQKATAQEPGIPGAYISRSKSEFECLNHDVYDVLLVRGKVRGLVVQARWFWKHLRKTRSRMRKSYFLVTAVRNKVTVRELENATCAKRAKNTTKLGQLAGHYLGTTIVRCPAPLSTIWTAFKVLAKTADGRLVSAFDGSEYKLGIWRSEAARADHGGGYYCYPDKTVALEATERGATFHESVSDGKSLVLCEVEIAGRQVEYDSGKVAASRLRVIQELQSVVLTACE